MVNPDRNLYDPPYDDALLYDQEMEPERPRSRSLIVMLAFVVLAAFAGVVWVAYNQGVQQGQRGVNPPVLSAEAGPSRVEPDASGVAPASNPAPEKSYERLWAGNGESNGIQENVMPRGEEPRAVPTTQEVAETVPKKPATTEPSVGGPLEKGTPMDPRVDSTVDLTGEVSGAPSLTAPSLERPSRGARGREDITEVIPESAPDEVVPPPAVPKVSKPVVKQTPPSSLQSAPRPIVPPAESAPPAEIQSSEVVPSESVAPKPASKAAIQLGSFPSSELAAAQWSKVKSANQDLLGAYAPQIVEATIPGKGVWYRLRVTGFSDKSAAKSVCDQLQSSGQACILAGK